MSERTFRRWRERYEAEGAAGLYPAPWAGLGAQRAGGRGDAGAGAVRDALPGHFTAKHFHEKLVCEHGFAELQLASPELAGARQDQAGAQARGEPEAAAPTGGGDDAAPGRLERGVAGQCLIQGRCDIGGLFGLLRCRGGHDDARSAGSAR